MFKCRRLLEEACFPSDQSCNCLSRLQVGERGILGKEDILVLLKPQVKGRGRERGKEVSSCFSSPSRNKDYAHLNKASMNVSFCKT